MYILFKLFYRLHGFIVETFHLLETPSSFHFSSWVGTDGSSLVVLSLTEFSLLHSPIPFSSHPHFSPPISLLTSTQLLFSLTFCFTHTIFHFALSFLSEWLSIRSIVWRLNSRLLICSPFLLQFSFSLGTRRGFLSIFPTSLSALHFRTDSNRKSLEQLRISSFRAILSIIKSARNEVTITLLQNSLQMEEYPWEVHPLSYSPFSFLFSLHRQ